MESYWVTFRIQSGLGYQDRYDKMLEAMIKARGDGASWGEPTSFWLVQSALDIGALARALTAPLNAHTDLVVIRALSKDSSVCFGKIEHMGILQTFLPNIRKIG